MKKGKLERIGHNHVIENRKSCGLSPEATCRKYNSGLTVALLVDIY